MTRTATSPHDVLTIGRAGIDLYPLQVGRTLDEVETFSKSVGGSPTNVAIAAAQHGRRAAVITKTGNDAFGRFIRRELGRLDVDTTFIGTSTDFQTPITFCEIHPPDHFPLTFYREPQAPDLDLHPEELPVAAIQDAMLYWATVTGLSKEPSRAAHHAAWAARGRQPHTVLDLDYRPMFWASPDEARREVARALDLVTVAVGNLEECEIAVGERDPERAADALLDRGVELAVVKRGAAGVLAKTRQERVEVAPIPVHVVNGLGSGDGFGGALCHGLLSEWSLARTIAFANAAGAIVATRRECSTAMPTTGDVDALLDQRAALDDADARTPMGDERIGDVRS